MGSLPIVVREAEPRIDDGNVFGRHSRLIDLRPIVLSGELAAREGGILEVDGEVQLAREDPLGQLVGGALLDGHPGARVGGADPRDGGGDEARERGREGADAQERALVIGDLGELERGEIEAHGDRVGMLEQQRAGRGELQPARPAVEQPRADLLLERRHLMRDRGLRQRERLGCPRERPMAGHRTEGEHSLRVHRCKLSLPKNHDLNEWQSALTLSP